MSPSNAPNARMICRKRQALGHPFWRGVGYSNKASFIFGLYEGVSAPRRGPWMSEHRMLEIIGDECRASPAAEAHAEIVSRKYGPAFNATLYQLLRRGYVDKRPSGRLALTKEGRTAPKG